jgi:hypothetical protein
MLTAVSPTLFHEKLPGLPTCLRIAAPVGGAVAVAALLASSRANFADPVFWFVALPAAIAIVAVPLTAAIWSLEIQVHQDHLTVHLRPGAKRDVQLTDVVSCEPRTFRPMREYLGWGRRVGPAGRALTVPGTKGVQLVLRTGEHLLVSSAEPETLAAAIQPSRRSSA